MRKNGQEPIAVSYFFRKPMANRNFSVEFVFRDVAERVGRSVPTRCVVAPFESKGVLRRLWNVVDAAFRQGMVNHVTGDIHYVGLLMRKNRTIQTFLDCGHLARTSGVRRALLRQFWLALPMRRCAAATAISQATKDDILRHLPDCDPDKISVIPVAISPQFRAVPKPFDKRRPRLLQVGTAANKNIERLAHALRGLDCELQIVGRLSRTQENELAACGVAYRAEWSLPLGEVVRRYQEADIVTLVSTFEGFGMPILEAQATGRPVITSNILSMPEVAGGGACLVDPTDVAAIRAGILRVIEDAEYREDLVRRGFENVERFKPERIARMYLEVYERVARGSGLAHR